MCAWVKIDDQFSDHPKVIEAGPLAECLFVRGLTYAARYLTDGFVPASHLRRMGDMDAIEEAGQLVAVGLWHEAGGGYQIHDYLDYNPSAEKVKAEREAARDRMGKARSSKPKANNQPRSEEVRANFAGSSDNPVPVPVPGVSNETLFDGADAPQPDDKPKRKRATQVPEDFALTDALKAWGAKNGYTEAQMLGQVPRFVDHYRGKGESRKDWSLSFHNWMRNAEAYGHLKPDPEPSSGGGWKVIRTVDSGYDPRQKLAPDSRTDYEQELVKSMVRDDGITVEEAWERLGRKSA